MAILRHVSKLFKHDEILVSPGYPIPYLEDKLHILRYTEQDNRACPQNQEIHHEE
jgi:hypothetical protein